MDIKYIIRTLPDNNEFPITDMFDCMGNRTNDLNKVYSIVVMLDNENWLSMEADEAIIFMRRLH